MPRQMPTTLGPRIRAQAHGESLLLTFPIGGRGSRHRRPLPDRPPTLQAFRSVLSETQSVSTQWLINGSRSYLRRHGVQSRGAAISYHKLTLSVYRKFCIPTPLRTLRSLRRKSMQIRCKIQQVEQEKQERKVAVLLYLLFSMLKTKPWKYGEGERTDDERQRTDDAAAGAKRNSAAILSRSSSVASPLQRTVYL